MQAHNLETVQVQIALNIQKAKEEFQGQWDLDMKAMGDQKEV